MRYRYNRAATSAQIQLTASAAAKAKPHHDPACLKDSPSTSETTMHASTKATTNQRSAHGSAWSSVPRINENRSSAVMRGRISGPNSRKNETADTRNALNQESLTGRRYAS